MKEVNYCTPKESAVFCARTSIKKCVICEKPLKRNQKTSCSIECRGNLSSIRNKGKKLSQEHKDKLSKAGQDRRFTDEQKIKISESVKKTLFDNPEIIEKRKKTCQERFGGNAPSCSDNVKSKMKQTNLERFGFEHAAQSDNVKSKMKQTCLERFGTESNLSSVEHQQAIKEKMIDLYGVEHALQSEHFLNKMKQTNLERFGFEHAAQSDNVKSKMKQTCLERFGVDNIQRKHLEDLMPILSSQKWWDQQSSFIDVKNKLNDRLSLSQIYLYAHQYRPDWNFRSSISSHHQRIIDLLNEYKIEHETNSRKIISPLELDIWIPSHSLAIEVNGVYWHSELAGGKDRNYHLNKTLECEKKGIQLLQFWDYEVEQKWDIVSSMILYKIKNQNIKKIPARKCSICDFSSKIANWFMEKNHLSGFRSGSIYRGLIFENELIGMLIAGSPRYTKNHDLEIIRFATSSNCRIQGGFSKLIKTLGKEKSIISYSDRRYSEGNVYRSSGWLFSHSSSPSYYYTNDYLNLFHRSHFQKHKLSKLLESYDPSETEWENMKKNGYDRIWDCGTMMWIYK